MKDTDLREVARVVPDDDLLADIGSQDRVEVRKPWKWMPSGWTMRGLKTVSSSRSICSRESGMCGRNSSASHLLWGVCPVSLCAVRLYLLVRKARSPPCQAGSALRQMAWRSASAVVNAEGAPRLTAYLAIARSSCLGHDFDHLLGHANGLLSDYDKCQAYIADVHSAFRSGS